jgi:hypothetical protein
MKDINNESKTQENKEKTVLNHNEVDLQNISPEERAIYNRVASAGDEWRESIQSTDMHDFSLAEDPFKLPLPAQKLRDKKLYVFRWITRDPKRLDEMMNKNKIMRWYPVNSTAPNGDFVKLVDRNCGAVCREDQMLVFKRYDAFLLEQEFYNGLASSSLNAGDLLNKSKKEEFSAANRKSEDSKSLRQEVKGSDIQFSGEAEVDAAAGIFTPNVSDTDLQAEV